MLPTTKKDVILKNFKLRRNLSPSIRLPMYSSNCLTDLGTCNGVISPVLDSMQSL